MTMADARPLEGLVVVDFSQFLAGPMATLRLADLGARVIKVERPVVGELGRGLVLAEQRLGGQSSLFHTINRGKSSVAADLKNPNDLDAVRELIASADVVVENFRPGVMGRLGLDPDDLCAKHTGLVYATVTGYGTDGPWRDLPGQDLLVQARSGLMWVNGAHDTPPTPIGLSIVDIYAGALLVQAILAALVRRGITGQGGRVATSLLEAAVDLQLEHLTVYLNAGSSFDSESAAAQTGQPRRDRIAPAHPFLPAPYGVYRTADGWLAIAMNPLSRISELLDITIPTVPAEHGRPGRDASKAVIASRIEDRTTRQWLDVLEPAGIWCAPVLDWAALTSDDAWRAAALEQDLPVAGAVPFRTTRCPIRFGGRILTGSSLAPPVGGQQSLAKMVAELGGGHGHDDTSPAARTADSEA